MRDLSRRDMLGALAAAGAGALVACERESAPEFDLPDGWEPGEERLVRTTCGQCPAGCGIDVRVVEGRAVKIEGNRAHPINGGGIGPKGQAGLQLLYHPDRIRSPLQREGPRGAGRWTSITWDTAIARVASELQKLRSAGRPQALVVVDGEPRGVMPRLWERFLLAYGSPNHVTHGSTSDGARLLAASLMQGANDLPAYDWANAEYVLGFGVGLFESWCQTIHMSRATGALRRGTPGRRAKFVHVAARFSATSVKADEWIPIAPGTEGALALGIAHVLVRDGLFDAAFVRDHTFGFDDWRDRAGVAHRGFRSVLLEQYAPETVAGTTGIAATVIERLARELSAHRPAIALGDSGAAGASNQLGTAMAIHALNALMGNLERRGGVLAQRQVLTPWTPATADDVARTALSAERIDGGGTARCPLGPGSIQFVPDAILAARPYPVEALILYRSNPVFSKPEGGKWIDAINKVPFVVSCSPLPDESTMWADLVLPDHTYLERAEIVEPSPSSGQLVLGLRQPAVQPRLRTMATGDAVIRVAQAIGGSVADAFPWSGYAHAISELPQVGAALPALRQDGFVATDAEFERWDDAFTTPSKRFEFYSQAIAAKLASLFPGEGELARYLQAHGIRARADDLCLPRWDVPRLAGDAAEYPFVIAPYRGINYAEGGVRHLPWLRELPAAGFLAWEETIDVNPRDARRLELRQGDAVWLETPVGRRRMCVRVHAGTPPGAIGLPLGHGPWPPRVEDAGRAGGHALLAATSDPLSGLFAHHGTRARIRTASAAERAAKSERSGA